MSARYLIVKAIRSVRLLNLVVPLTHKVTVKRTTETTGSIPAGLAQFLR